MTDLLKDALRKAAMFCAYQERTQQEVRERLKDWGVLGDDAEEVIAELIQQNYLNEERFAIQYAGGNHYVFVTPSPNNSAFMESTVQPGIYLAEGSGVGRGVNTLVNGSDNSYYGIDLLFSTIP